MLTRYSPRPVEVSCQSLIKYLIDKTALSGTGDTCDTCKNTKRNIHIYILEVILPCSLYCEITCRFSSLFRDKYLSSSTEVRTCYGILILHYLLCRTCSYNLPAMFARCRTYIYNIIRCTHSILIVLDNYKCIA